jgi:hypothetical protein
MKHGSAVADIDTAHAQYIFFFKINNNQKAIKIETERYWTIQMSLFP